jgi:hypothetical protein
MKKQYLVISQPSNRLSAYSTYVEVGHGESLVAELDFCFGIREDEILFVFEGHPKRISLITLTEQENV